MRIASLQAPKVFYLVLTGLVLASLACSLSLTGLLDSIQGSDQEVERTQEALETASASIPATPTPTITPTPLGPHAFDLLGDLPALSTTRQQLSSMQIIRASDQSVLTGTDLLLWILVNQGYEPEWTHARREQLLADLDDYEFPSPGQRILLLNVAHGLALEASGSVPWSLQDYSTMEIRNLYIEDTATHIRNPYLDRGLLPAGMPNLQTHTHPMPDEIVEDAHFFQYHLARRLIGEASSHSDAVADIVVWMQQNFFHAYDAYPWDVYLDGREPLGGGGPAAYPASLSRIYEERVTGCHEPTVMLEGMLHALNIPALRLKVHGHGVLYLPTLDRYVHGDHVAMYTAAPRGVLLLTPDEFRPFAEDVAWIFQIYFDKHEPPVASVPLMRDGDFLYIYAHNLITRPDMNCVVISAEDWDWMSRQLEAFNIQYDTVNCDLTSDRVPILTLEALNAPAE